MGICGSINHLNHPWLLLMWTRGFLSGRPCFALGFWPARPGSGKIYPRNSGYEDQKG